MTWKRETVRARFMTRLERALGRCAHCPRHCPPTPALHPPIGDAMNVDLRPQHMESRSMEIDIDLSHLRHIRIDLIEGAAPRITLIAGHKSNHVSRGGFIEEGGIMTIPITRDRMNAILDQFNP